MRNSKIGELHKIHKSYTIDDKIADGTERISEIIKAILIDVADNFKISHTQAHIILSIDENGISQKSLKEKLALDISTLSKSIKNLKQKRLISIEKKEKSKMIYLTKEGGKAKKSIIDKISKVVKNVTYNLSYQEKVSVYKFIYKFIEHSLAEKVISYQRMCSTCKFFRYEQNSLYCLFLRKKLRPQDLMINCPDYISHN